MSAQPDTWRPPVSARDNGYISAAPLARVLRWMFGGWVVLTAFGASSSYFAYRSISSLLDGDASIDVNQVDTMHTIASAIVVLELIALLSTGVVFITWTRRVYRNVAPLGGETRFKPGWAVGGWFVPLLNLVRPKQILDDAWRAGMVDNRDPDHVDKPPFMELWWALFVVAPFAASFLSHSDEDGARGRAQYFEFRGLAQLAWMVAAVLAFWVVVRLTDRQDAKAAARWSTSGVAGAAWPGADPQRGSLRHEALLRWLLPAVGIVSLVAASAFLAPRPHSTLAGAEMEVGNCFDDRATADTDDLDPVSVDCDELHESEIYAARTRSTGELPPLESQRLDEEEVYCRSEFESFVGVPYEDSKYDFSVIWRDVGGDDPAERRIACVISMPDFIPTRGTAADDGE